MSRSAGTKPEDAVALIDSGSRGRSGADADRVGGAAS